MAIAFDATSLSTYKAAGAGTLTWSHACTGSDLILWVYAYCGNNSAVTSPTYNGSAMTVHQSLAMTGGAAGQYIRSWYIIAPSTGTNTVSLTSNSDMYGFGASYTGAAQTGQPDSGNTQALTPVNSITTSTTTIADNCWLVGFSYTGNAQTAGSNTTLRANTSSILYIIDSNSAQTPAGSKSLSVTCSNTFAGMLVASIAPVASGSTVNSAFFNFM